MPTYVYRCMNDHKWDVIKPIAALNKPEACPHCSSESGGNVITQGQRQVAAPNINRSAAADWNTPHFSPALGCEVKSNQHARQIAKARGMEEVGTEPPEKIHKKSERDQAETRERRWAEADREKVFE